MDTDDRWLPLGYDTLHLPGFVLPSARDKLKLIHGSCRKPHGGGPDMLPLVDALISDSRALPGSRPQQLFLTGDQIYADDVAPGLLPALTEAGDGSPVPRRRTMTGGAWRCSPSITGASMRCGQGNRWPV